MDYSEDTIKQIAIHYFNGSATGEEEEMLFRFMKESVANKQSFRRWEAEWMALPKIQPETDREWARLRQRVSLGGQPLRKSRVYHLTRIGWVAAAAVVGILLVWGGYWGTMSYVGKMADNNLFVLATGKGEKTRFYLADGTSVYLNSGSTLQYSGSFNTRQREVILSGEAYFEVTKQPGDVPFTVRTDGYDVVVKGTSFNVTAYPDDSNVITTLMEGAVQVRCGEEEIAISPGEQLVLNKASGEITKETVQSNQFMAWTEGRFEYDEISLQDLVKRMERQYNVTIELDKQIQEDMVFRISLRNEETVDDILEALIQLAPLRYEKVGRHIRIYK